MARLRRITIRAALKQLLNVVGRLRSAYGDRKAFTLDGRLVGDIGEVLVEEAYSVELLEGLHKQHDARTRGGRLVQIKATMKESLTFPADHVPNYYLGIKILPDGSFREVFNGPGRIAYLAIKHRARPKTSLHSIPIARLAALQARVKPDGRIPLRRRVAARRSARTARVNGAR